MPKPKKGETEREFLSRCIPELAHEGYDNNSQRVAICLNVYRKEGTEKASPKPQKKKMSKEDKKKVAECLNCF